MTKSCFSAKKTHFSAKSRAFFSAKNHVFSAIFEVVSISAFSLLAHLRLLAHFFLRTLFIGTTVVAHSLIFSLFRCFGEFLEQVSGYDLIL